MSFELEDCFSYGGALLPVQDALARLQARVRPQVGRETVPLSAAHGRILARAITSPRDVPAFDNAAVDGYAFAHTALAAAGETRLPLAAGRAAAGHPFGRALPLGMAVRVLTGAPLPEGTDSVVMEEETRFEGDRVVLPAGIRAHANRRRAGEDIARGATILEPGHRLRPQDIGVAAETGHAALEVFCELRVALFSSGDELREPGEPLPASGVYDANRHMLAALLARLPASVTDLGILPDRGDAVAEALAAAAAAHDVVLTSGGAAGGDEDHVVRTVRDRGRLHLWRIAMKPGRPLAFGRIGHATFVGLPGNPVAAMVCFLRFARPVLLRLAGAPWTEPIPMRVPAGFTLKKRPGRTEMLRAVLEPAEDGTARLRRIAREGSGILTSMVEADGLIELAHDTVEVREGEPVAFYPFEMLGVGG